MKKILIILFSLLIVSCTSDDISSSSVYSSNSYSESVVNSYDSEAISSIDSSSISSCNSELSSTISEVSNVVTTGTIEYPGIE